MKDITTKLDKRNGPGIEPSTFCAYEAEAVSKSNLKMDGNGGLMTPTVIVFFVILANFSKGLKKNKHFPQLFDARKNL